MTTFDRSLQYQFVVLTEPPPADAPVPELDAALGAQVDGVEPLGLRLRPGPTTQIALLQGGIAMTGQGRSWTAASGIWRVNWSPERIDAAFNARGYAEVRDSDEAVPVTMARKRVVGNLLAACEAARQRVTRLVLIVNAESSCPDRNVQEVVASLFFDSEIQKAAKEGRAVDMMARTNIQDQWMLAGRAGGAREVKVNRLQTLAAVGLFRGKETDTYLSVQLEANTALELNLADSVHSSGLGKFFELADTWVTEKLRAIEGACRS
jgi:hypothetical protein